WTLTQGERINFPSGSAYWCLPCHHLDLSVPPTKTARPRRAAAETAGLDTGSMPNPCRALARPRQTSLLFVPPLAPSPVSPNGLKPEPLSLLGSVFENPRRCLRFPRSRKEPTALLSRPL